MKRKILITGISSEIMRKFIALVDFSKYDVVGITRNPERISLDNVELIKGDICNFDGLSRHMDGCHMVIHAAAVTHSFKKKEYYRVNLDGTKSIVDHAKARNVERFVFISSNTAGTDSGAYGLSKLLAEEYVRKHLAGWMIFRPSEIYGGSKQEGIEKLINDVIDKSVVFCPQDVPCDFFPIHIDDAVRIMYECSFGEAYLNKITVINGPRGLSFGDVIALTKGISHSRIRVIPVSRRLMSAFRGIAEVLPLYIGVLPDQISRLYSVKSLGRAGDNMMDIETYIRKLAVEKKRPQMCDSGIAA